MYNILSKSLYFVCMEIIILCYKLLVSYVGLLERIEKHITNIFKNLKSCKDFKYYNQI